MYAKGITKILVSTFLDLDEAQVLAARLGFKFLSHNREIYALSPTGIWFETVLNLDDFEA
jgi:hypothetical protein